MKKIEQLLKYEQEILSLQYTINLLEWELRISAPKKSEEDLIHLITKYENELFQMKTSTKYGILLQEIVESIEFQEIEVPEQRYILDLLKRYNEDKKIPSDFYIEYAELKNKSNIAWREAKEKNDSSLFFPYFKQIVEMTKKCYRYIDSETSNLYDVMLDSYEMGVKSKQIDPLFEELKKRILPLIPKTTVFSNVPKVTYRDSELIECAEYLLKYIGFDMNRGALGIYPHGFTEKLGPNDIRITFRHTKDPIDFVTTVIHEGGHGIFEQNMKESLTKYENSPLNHLYALHESQSRFYENILGRNKNFWIPIYDKVKEMLHLTIDLDQFIKFLNCPNPGLIRVEADELTYCMHIILRYEIERDLFNGNLTVEEIPSVWKKKMKEYLNVDVENDIDGFMQDVHWSEGDFGYFPSYLLGSIYDGMFLDAIKRDLGDIDFLLKEGRVQEITDYLIKNIHQNGGAYTSNEIIEKLCGFDITIEPIARYFEEKYGNK